MATCNECIHKELCYMIEHYGRDLETDIACKRFKSKDEFEQVVYGVWIKTGNRRDCSRCGFSYYSSGDSFKRCPDCGAVMRRKGIG